MEVVFTHGKTDTRTDGQTDIEVEIVFNFTNLWGRFRGERELFNVLQF